MPYIGQQPEIGAYKKLDSITAVNGQAAYTLQYNSANYSPASANHLIVSLNGVIQAPQDSFTVSGSTLSFASNLSTGDSIDFVLALGDVLNIGSPSDNTVTNDKLATAPTIISKGAGSDSGAIQLNCEVNTHGVKIKGPPHSASQSYTLTLPSTAPSNGKALITDGSGNLSFGSAGVFGSALLEVVHEETSGTSGGTATSGSFQTRTLNTVKTNEITGASLSSNQITLPSGTYFCDAVAPCYSVSYHKSLLYNVTDATEVLFGTNSMAHQTYGNVTDSHIYGRFTISASKVFEIRTRVQTSRSTNGFGLAHTYGVTEKFSSVKIWKVG